MQQNQYYQDWSYAIALAKHSWRFYLLKPDATVDKMTEATRKAWISCHVVWADLTGLERDIVRTYHTFKGNAAEQDNAMRLKANTLGIPYTMARSALVKSWRMWAVKRGLADVRERADEVDAIWKSETTNAMERTNADRLLYADYAETVNPPHNGESEPEPDRVGYLTHCTQQCFSALNRHDSENSEIGGV